MEKKPLVLYNHSLWSCTLSVFINSINYCVFLGLFTTSASEVLHFCDEGSVLGKMGISPPPTFQMLPPVPHCQGQGLHGTEQPVKLH